MTTANLLYIVIRRPRKQLFSLYDLLKLHVCSFNAISESTRSTRFYPAICEETRTLSPVRGKIRRAFHHQTQIIHPREVRMERTLVREDKLIKLRLILLEQRCKQFIEKKILRFYDGE